MRWYCSDSLTEHLWFRIVVQEVTHMKNEKRICFIPSTELLARLDLGREALAKADGSGTKPTYQAAVSRLLTAALDAMGVH